MALAGILAAVKATKTRLQDHTFLFQGAGEAAIGIAQLIAMAMHKREGVPLDQARQKVWLKDSRGLIVKDRSVVAIKLGNQDKNAGRQGVCHHTRCPLPTPTSRWRISPTLSGS